VTALPEVEESTSYRTPAFKVRGKLFLRLRHTRGGRAPRDWHDFRKERDNLGQTVFAGYHYWTATTG
jgi:hypothetical protein